MAGRCESAAFSSDDSGGQDACSSLRLLRLNPFRQACFDALGIPKDRPTRPVSGARCGRGVLNETPDMLDAADRLVVRARACVAGRLGVFRNGRVREHHSATFPSMGRWDEDLTCFLPHATVHSAFHLVLNWVIVRRGWTRAAIRPGSDDVPVSPRMDRSA